MALWSGLLRMLAASAVSSAITWLIVSSSHPCDSTGGTPFGWLAVFLPAAAGFACSLPRYNPVVCVLGGMSASLATVAALLIDINRDGIVSPSGASCETAGPAIAGAALLVVITFVILTALLLVLHALGIGRQGETT